MSNKGVAVEGDVGQVVAGNVVHEGAKPSNHLSNVITIGASQPIPPVKTITELQRKRIAAKVKEVMEVAGIERQLDVYSVVLSDFGVERILDLPCDQFKSVMAMLDGWIAEEAQGQAPEQQSPAQPAPSACPSCDALSTRIGTLQSRVRMIAMGAVAALGLAGYGIYAGTLPAASSIPPARECRLDGKDHSIGSMVRMTDNAIYECVATGPDAAPAWAPARNLGSAGKRR